MTRGIGIHFEPEDRTPVLEIRAELASANDPVIVWLEVVLTPPLVVVSLMVALA